MLRERKYPVSINYYLLNLVLTCNLDLGHTTSLSLYAKLSGTKIHLLIVFFFPMYISYIFFLFHKFCINSHSSERVCE